MGARLIWMDCGAPLCNMSYYFLNTSAPMIKIIPHDKITLNSKFEYVTYTKILINVLFVYMRNRNNPRVKKFEIAPMNSSIGIIIVMRDIVFDISFFLLIVLNTIILYK